MDAMGLIWGISPMILKEVGMTFGSSDWAVLVFPGANGQFSPP